MTVQPRPDRPVSVFVDPSSTSSAIVAETAPERQHQVLSGPGERGLVLFLGGSGSEPGHYTELVTHVASLGYATVNLRYPNDQVIGLHCLEQPACFAEVRGEVAYGANTPDPQERIYDSDIVEVDAMSSISGRLVALLQHLGAEDPRWHQFLVADASSPYAGDQGEPARPAWEAITVSGHSQGGGTAAFLAMSTPVRRVVMLSAPNDNAAGAPAPWITSPSATPLDRYYGLRSGDEGILGSFIEQSWHALGGPGNGLPGDPVDVGDGSGAPRDSHHLVLSPPEDGDAFTNHLSTATDLVHSPAVRDAWTYLFTDLEG